MVLFAVFGDLGSGKTSTGVYLVYKNWVEKEMKVFSNLPLFYIPYGHITSLGQMYQVRDGVLLLDEMWTFCDARLSTKQINRFVADIARRSRKRHVTYMYTAQLPDQVDKRIRKITDFSAWPFFNSTETMCKVMVFRACKKKPALFLKVLRYYTYNVFLLYDTDGDILDMDPNMDESRLIKFYFQPGDKAERLEFKTWEDANDYAVKWWTEHSNDFYARAAKMLKFLMIKPQLKNPYARFKDYEDKL